MISSVRNVPVRIQQALRVRQIVPSIVGLALLLALAISPVIASDYAVKDTFNLDGPGTPLPDHRLETDTVGGGWVQGVGSDFRISLDSLSTHDVGLDVAPGIAVIDTKVSKYDLSVTVSREKHGGVTGLIFRYVDAENYFSAVHDGRRARLTKVVDGVETVLDQRSVGLDRDGTSVWSVQVRNDSIVVRVDGRSRLATRDATFAGATYTGLVHESVQTTSFRDFQVESDEGSPDPPPAPEPAPPIVSDSFTAPDGTPVPSHTGTEVTSGGLWSGMRGEWVISGGEARLQSPDSELFFADQIVVIPANGEVDQEISADITWFGGNAGVVWNATDTQNYSLAFWEGHYIVVGRIESGAFFEKGRRQALWSPGQTRNLKVRVNGEQASVSLDDGEPILLTFRIPEPTVLNAGVFVRLDVGNRFDNFLVRPSALLAMPTPVIPNDAPFPSIITEPPADSWLFDSFNSPNYILLRHHTPELDPSGSGWTDVAGFWQIWQAQASDQSAVFGPGGYDRFAVIDTGVDEYKLEASIKWDGGRVGVLFGGRATGPDDAGRNGFIFFRNGDRLEVGRLVGGAYFRIDRTDDFNWNPGARRVMKVEVREEEAELKLNGKTVFEFSDPALEFSTWAGLFQRGSNFERFNDFTVALPEGAEPPSDPAIGPIADVEMVVGQKVALTIPLTGLDGTGFELTASALKRPDGTVVVDTFTEVNGTGVQIADHLPEQSPAGAGWVKVRPGAEPVIGDGMLRIPVGGDGGDQRVVIDTGYQDVELSSQVEAIDGRFGLVARHDGSADDRNWIMGWVDAESGLAFLARNTNGEFRVLSHVPFAWTPGDTRIMSLRVIGSAVSLLVDGGVVMTAEAEDLPSGTHAGLFSRKIGEDGQFQDFTARGLGLPEFISLDGVGAGAPLLHIDPLPRDSGTYEVVIEARIGSGSLSTAFALTVAPLMGPTANAGGPYVTGEGLAVTLDSTGSTAGDGSIVSYEWDTDGDGLADLSGATVEFHPPGTGQYVVDLLVKDENGMASGATATVTVVSPHPAVDLSSLVTVDSAGIDGTKMALTADLLWQRGAAWSPEKVPVASGFAVDFTLGFEAGSTLVADGIAFVIQNSPDGTAAIGAAGDGLGYSFIENSLVIEFDTWVNTSFGESGPHIAVHGIDSVQNTSTDATRVAMVNVPGILSAPVIRARVEYIPGTLRVYLENFSLPIIEVAIDLAAQMDLPAGTAYIGFTASTGGASAMHSVSGFHFGN